MQFPFKDFFSVVAFQPSSPSLLHICSNHLLDRWHCPQQCPLSCACWVQPPCQQCRLMPGILCNTPSPPLSPLVNAMMPMSVLLMPTVLISPHLHLLHWHQCLHSRQLPPPPHPLPTPATPMLVPSMPTMTMPHLLCAHISAVDAQHLHHLTSALVHMQPHPLLTLSQCSLCPCWHHCTPVTSAPLTPAMPITHVSAIGAHANPPRHPPSMPAMPMLAPSMPTPDAHVGSTPHLHPPPLWQHPLHPHECHQFPLWLHYLYVLSSLAQSTAPSIVHSPINIPCALLLILTVTTIHYYLLYVLDAVVVNEKIYYT